jgi:hypothetical protein
MAAAAMATEPPNGVPERALDRLFRGPLEEFTAARDQLAKSLGSDGNAEAADWVKRLQKPTRAAWLVNQVAAKNAKAMGQLLRAGAQLHDAQDEMLTGSTDRGKLRESAERERKAIDSLTETAERIGEQNGVSRQILARVSETLQAAASDPEVAEAIERGRLTREQRTASIGLIGSAKHALRSTEWEADREESSRRARRQLAKRRQAAERKLAAREKKLEGERGRLERALQVAEEAERRLREAELDANAARRELDEL